MVESPPAPGQKPPDRTTSQLISRLFVNAPFEQLLAGLLKLFLDNGIRPEIGLEGSCLYDRKAKDFELVASSLVEAGLPCTLHAPFGDLCPGSPDPEIHGKTRDKLLRAFELVEIFKPVSIVCHLGIKDNKPSPDYDDWLAASLETWRELLAIAESHRVVMMLENTYEANAEDLVRLLTALDSPFARFCLDTGHVLAFAGNTWRDWLGPLEPWLGQLHLHDNQGKSDQHLAVGSGIFDFAGMFSYLRTRDLRPIITLEPHREDDLWTSLQTLADLELPEPPTNTTR